MEALAKLLYEWPIVFQKESMLKRVRINKRYPDLKRN